MSTFSSLSSKSMASFSISKSFQGKAYLYSQLNQKFQSHLQKNKTITKIYVYESPLSSLQNAKESIVQGYKNIIQNPMSKLKTLCSGVIRPEVIVFEGMKDLASYGGITIANEIIKHHEIIIEIEQMAYVLLSFGQDGLQCGIHGELEPLVTRRKKNNKILQFETQIQGKRIKDFLIQNQIVNYNLMHWNCQHFCDALLKYLK